MESEYVLYILMRKDLPSMNAGKAMAQASHASNAFIHNMNNKSNKHVEEWQNSTDQGFGTVLVLGCQISDIVGISTSVFDVRKESAFEQIIDPTYPYIVNSEIKDLIDKSIHTMEPHKLESGDFVCFREEVTCAYLFADKNSDETKRLIGHLKLHP
jgi:hypothetical protein